MNPDDNKSQAEKLRAALLKEEKAKEEAPLENIKTYQNDVAEAIKRDNVSVIKMAVAEKRRQERQGVDSEAVETESKKRLIFISLSVFLILAGLGLIGFFYFSHKSTSGVVVTTVPQNIIDADKTTAINLDTVTSAALLSDMNTLKATLLSNGSIESLVPTVESNYLNATSVDDITRRELTPQELMNLFHARVPGPFFRSLSNIYMLGFYQNGSTTETFLILKTDSYQDAFAGMLAWEPQIQTDLGPLFSIPAPSQNAAFSNPFTDRVIDNRDARILNDANGNPLLIYSFIDPGTLIMVQSSNAFDEILSRYLQNKETR